MTLPMFEDDPVSEARVKITRAGDGLSEALKLLPIAQHIGAESYFVLRTVVKAVDHREDKHGRLVRTHIAETIEIAETDETTAKAAMAKAFEMLEKARAEQAGQLAIEAGAEDAEGDESS